MSASGACAVATLLFHHHADAETTMTSQTETASEQSQRIGTPSQAAEWGRDTKEWARYETLMRGIRGRRSTERISPIEVLGIHARSEAERRRYAEAWVQTLHEDTARVLAFEQAVQEAWRRRYGDEHTLDLARVPGRTDDYLKAGDRLVLHTRAVQCAACDVLASELFVCVWVFGFGLDIYFVDGDDDELRSKAATNRMLVVWVQSRRLTLNHDPQTLLRGKEVWRALPDLYVRRGGALRAVAYKALRWPAVSRCSCR